MNTVSPLLDQPPVVSGHWSTVLAIVLIFAFGCFSGGLSMSMVDRQRETDAILHGQDQLGNTLERRLMRGVELDAAQKQKVRDLFGDNSAQRKLLQAQLHPQIQALDHATVAKVNAILRPDQRDHFQQNIMQLQVRYGDQLFDPGASIDAPAPAPTP